ncbi:class I SAM-dependent methyltransferase [Streptosporangium sandarakinum]|uniref:class I SAM-dependent methyltransferase n=1 Tax=Streptosporangium sandarakinum TaxID=1260955 RepID=UPI00342AD7E8
MAELRGFDQAADYYDETRDLDPTARRSLTDILLEEVKGKQCLEVGVGTGLVGLALSRRGVPIVGADLSSRMLARLAGKFDRPHEMGLVQADATKLPFRRASFDAVLSSQMLHLVDDWRRVLKECIGVLRPGGLLLIDLGNEPDSGWGGPWREVGRRFWEFARPEGRRMPEVWTDGLVDAELSNMGWIGRGLRKVTAFEHRSLGDIIDRLDAGLWSACWPLPEDMRHEAAERTRAWALATYGDLSERFRVERTIAWRAYTAVNETS